MKTKVYESPVSTVATYDTEHPILTVSFPTPEEQDIEEVFINPDNIGEKDAKDAASRYNLWNNFW